MQCLKCGFESPEGSRFCANCGNTLEVLEEPIIKDGPQIVEEPVLKPVKEKKSKLPIILIVLLVIAILGFIGYISFGPLMMDLLYPSKDPVPTDKVDGDDVVEYKEVEFNGLKMEYDTSLFELKEDNNDKYLYDVTSKSYLGLFGETKYSEISEYLCDDLEEDVCAESVSSLFKKNLGIELEENNLNYTIKEIESTKLINGFYLTEYSLYNDKEVLNKNIYLVLNKDTDQMISFVSMFDEIEEKDKEKLGNEFYTLISKGEFK